LYITTKDGKKEPLFVTDKFGNSEPLLVGVATKFSAAVEACKELNEIERESIKRFIKDNSDYVTEGIKDLVKDGFEKAEQINNFVHNMIDRIDLDSLTTNVQVIIDILTELIKPLL